MCLTAKNYTNQVNLVKNNLGYYDLGSSFMSLFGLVFIVNLISNYVNY